MKKILLILGMMLFCSAVYAGQDLRFIYINGSNVNDEKMYKWWTESVEKFHPVLKKKVEKDKKIKHWVFKDETFTVEEEPVLFYWGDKSKADLDFVQESLLSSKNLSSFLAYKFRDVLTKFLHDAIWVQKSHNMRPILNELNEIVKNEHTQGRQSVLFGYSAGTFITFQYLLNKVRYIDLIDLAKIYSKDETAIKFIEEHPRQKTCLNALEDSGLAVVSADDKLVFFKDRKHFKESYDKLDETTELVCAPNNSIKGVINFASPLVLFYSDISDPNVELTNYNKYLLKHIFENDMFTLNINYREDPLGFPAIKNATYEQLAAKTGVNITNPEGMVYENSGVWSGRSFAFAHTSYYSARKIFPRALRKNLINGYRLQYDEEYRAKELKKLEKEYEQL